MAKSGLSRKRTWFAGKATPSTMEGGQRSRTTTSVRVTGRHFPART